ncbi:hypothetical protein [Streptomyces sp. NPDC053431]|uniref:hypothetical protein n=1 Tax=Streptomyces sp. NPDC053431 TaxID=3365703 RepID=UPI0037D18825
MRAAKATAMAVLTAAVLAGCGNGSDANGKDGADPAATGGDKALATMTLPPAYDAGKGWDETLPWVPGEADEPPVAVLPRAAAVALLTLDDSAGFALRTKAADTGKDRWTSAAWHPPTPMDDARSEGEIPAVLGYEQDGREYVVLSAHGMTGKDALHDGTEVVRLAVYAADGEGTGRKPLREIDVPVDAEENEWRVSADGGRLLVAYGEHGRYPSRSVAVDVATGRMTRYENPNDLLNGQCENKPYECGWSRVVAVGAKGPLVGLGHGFSVPGVWTSEDVRPEGAAPSPPGGLSFDTNGDVYGVAGGRFLAQWHGPERNGSSGPTEWSVHDIATGAVLARMECAYEAFPSKGVEGHSREYPVVTSPSGRFLAAGPVTFDVERKQGVCLQGDGNAKTVAVESVADDGTAYGKVDGDASAEVFARLDLTTKTGDAKVLDAGVEIPLHTGVAGAGLFVVRDQHENLRVSLRAAR